jgi:voltage-gated potassium channel
VNILARRLIGALVALLVIVVLGASGFWLIGDGRWSIGECAYMTIVSATTVGFGETLEGMHHVPAARGWAVFVILLGVGTFGFAASMLTAFVVESDLRASFRRKAMRKQILGLSGHTIVCGVGSTGGHVVREMVATKSPVVAIDTNAHRLEALAAELGQNAFLWIVGDATEDSLLESAGVTRARGLVTSLPDDKDNLFVVVSARGLAPNLRIVSRSHDPRTAEKLRKAGAQAVVSPNLIGGMRLASEMLRPDVVEFLDVMLRDRDRALRIEDVRIAPTSELVGGTIEGARIRDRTKVLVLAVRNGDSPEFAYNPGPATPLAAGTTLVVLGHVDEVRALRTLAGDPRTS